MSSPQPPMRNGYETMQSPHNELPAPLIDRIHAAALAGDGWVSLVPELEAMLRARVAIFEQGARGVSALAFCSHAQPRAIQAYESTFWNQDCAMRELRAASVGHIVQDSAIVGEHRNGRDEFYAGYLEALDGRCGLYGLAHRGRDSQFVVSARRGIAGGDFNERERDLLMRLTPHLGRAFRTWHALRSEREVAGGLLQSLKQTGAAMLLVDRHMRVHFASDVARRRLADAPMLIVGETLAGRSASADQRLRKAIEAVLSDDRRDGPARVLLPSWGAGAPLSLSVAALVTDFPTDPDVGALAIVNVSAGEEPNVCEDALRAFFGLTNAEARLLKALTSGERLADYAARTGVSPTTAKSHLRALFSKTGERRQVDLVRNVLSLARSGLLSKSGTA